MLKHKLLLTTLIKNLHFVYLLYAFPLLYILVTLTPPYQVPDEANHFSRAEQVSRFEWIPDYHPESADFFKHHADTSIVLPRSNGGFRVDKGIASSYHYFSDINFHPDVKVSAEKINRAKQIQWNTGVEYLNFANTAIYPPTVYLMTGLGIAFGRLAHLTVLQTLYLSRILNALLALTLCFIALLLAEKSKLILFIGLLFPMTLSLFASISQDAVLISCSFLLIAMIDHAEAHDHRSYKGVYFYTIIILITVIATAKPPYLLLATAFIFLKLNAKQKIISIGVPLIAVMVWLALIHSNFSVIFAPPELKINARLQLMHILHHPLKFISLFFKFDADGIALFCRMVVGVLGWMDLYFSNLYYQLTYVIIFFGLICSYKVNGGANLKLNIALFTSALLTFIAVLAAQYITWTPLDSPTLGGMQGRYFLPIYPLFALALSTPQGGFSFNKFQLVLLAVIMLFPIFTSLNLINNLIVRYYLI